MNYYLDLLPHDTFMSNAATMKERYPDHDFILNLYVRELPSMNLTSALYTDRRETETLLESLTGAGFRCNIMMDSTCFGNLEFDRDYSREITAHLDGLLSLNPFSFTVTNFLYFRLIGELSPGTKRIFSEYLDIDTVQKIARYLEDLGGDGVKVNLDMLKDRTRAEAIAAAFDARSIHINANAGYIENDIHRDTINNHIAHYLQKGEGEKAREMIRSHRDGCPGFDERLLFLDNDDCEFLAGAGFTAFWIYCTSANADEYLRDIEHVLERESTPRRLYPWCLV